MYMNLHDLRKDLAGFKQVAFKEEVVGGETVTIVSYMINTPDLWKVRNGLEARGITFNSEGRLISLPFQKFFNLNETEETQSGNLNMDDFSFYEKMDGSMITPALISDVVYFKTKKSFHSDVARLANANVTDPVRELSRYLLTNHMCPIFEFMCPENKVVIDYGQEPRWTLLAIRNMVDGRHLHQEFLEATAKNFGVSCVAADWTVSPELIHEMEGIEGFVAVHRDGQQRFKVKTKWYLDRHRMLDIRERDIASLWLDEKLDDMIPELQAAECDMNRVDKIVFDLGNMWQSIVENVEEVSSQVKHLTGKERADKVFELNRTYSNMIFRAAAGQEWLPMVMDFIRKNRLSEFSLKSISNSNFGQFDQEG